MTYLLGRTHVKKQLQATMVCFMHLYTNPVFYHPKDIILIQGWKDWYSPIDTFHTDKGIFQYSEIKDFYCIHNFQIYNPSI